MLVDAGEGTHSRAAVEFAARETDLRERAPNGGGRPGESGLSPCFGAGRTDGVSREVWDEFGVLDVERSQTRALGTLRR